MLRSIIFSLLYLSISQVSLLAGNSSQDYAKRITWNQFLKIVEKNPDLNLLDNRSPHEYSAGHFKNAQIYNPHGPTFVADIEKLNKDKTYYLYCHSGNRSHSVHDLMLNKGFKVFDISGGISACKTNPKCSKFIQR